MPSKTATWGEVLTDFLQFGRKAAVEVQRYAHLSKQATNSIVAREPDSEEQVPEGWLVVTLAPASIYRDEWSAAQAISPVVRRCFKGHLCDGNESGLVVIPSKYGSDFHPRLIS